MCVNCGDPWCGDPIAVTALVVSENGTFGGSVECIASLCEFNGDCLCDHEYVCEWEVNEIMNVRAAVRRVCECGCAHARYVSRTLICRCSDVVLRVRRLQATRSHFIPTSSPISDISG